MNIPISIIMYVHVLLLTLFAERSSAGSSPARCLPAGADDYSCYVISFY